MCPYVDVYDILQRLQAVPTKDRNSISTTFYGYRRKPKHQLPNQERALQQRRLSSRVAREAFYSLNLFRSNRLATEGLNEFVVIDSILACLYLQEWVGL